MQNNRERDQEQVHQIPYLISMNIEDHYTPPPLVPVVSNDQLDNAFIGSPLVPEGEPLGEYGPLVIPIPPEPPSHQSPQGSTPGLPIWERDKKSINKSKPS